MPTPARPLSFSRPSETTVSIVKSNPDTDIKSQSPWKSRLFRRRQTSRSWSIDFNSSYPYSMDSTAAVSVSSTTTISDSSILAIDQVSTDLDPKAIVSIEFPSQPALSLQKAPPSSSPFERLLRSDVNYASSLHSRSSADYHESQAQTCRDFLR
ncbi:hypothetical protein B0A52_06065 [Exophiala mesophila]|uniref:Uncharacterized protein n=1 Tax=Exophiala mesophila TaxID=212818 RepID=A0A438N572_EXOME|nr:hypothetical protein B0A52_06065 [Exophiala mesophila]